VVKRGDTASTAFALDAASRLLPYYNSYFATPYPLPKLDLVAAPGASQSFGAMENWGAIFAFESDLLIDPRVSTEGTSSWSTSWWRTRWRISGSAIS